MMNRARSVQVRILLRQLPLLLLVLVGVLLWLDRYLTQVLYSSNLEVARRSATAVVYAIQASMLTEGAHRVWERVLEKIPSLEGAQIEIINMEGEVLSSTDRTAKQSTHRLTDPSCAVCHEKDTLRPLAQSAFFRDPGDERHQVFAAPLRNTEDCRPCHSSGGPKLGMVFVRQTLEPIHRDIRTVQIGLVAAGTIALVLSGLTFRLLLGRYLNRPLRRLVAGAQAIGRGDLKHTIELPDQTELTVLADTLNQSTTQLLNLQSELLQQERLAAIGETMAGLAHSLKNMLNSLRAGQYVIERALEKDDPEKLRTGWRVLNSSVRQVERLVFNMLYTLKGRVPEREPIDLNQILREVIEALKETAAAQEIHLQEDLDPSVGTVAMDRTAIHRAIIEIVTNAMDACTESESGDLVVLKSHGTPGEIVLTVADNGIGMPEAVRQGLFSRFFSTKGAKGTGLGLVVAKKIIEEHGGTLDVDSTVGKGSTFHIRLPRTSPGPAHRPGGEASVGRGRS